MLWFLLIALVLDVVLSDDGCLHCLRTIYLDYLVPHCEANLALPDVTASSAQPAQDAVEHSLHLLVPEEVDDGVDEGVALSQHQAVLLVAQHLARVTPQAVKKQHHQARCPADHKTTCRV